MAKKFPILPKHPERTCWGCDKYCAATSLICGNGSERTQHPVELFGPDWLDWLPDAADDEALAPRPNPLRQVNDAAATRVDWRPPSQQT